MRATHMRLYEIFALLSAFMSAVHLLSCMCGAVKIAYPELAAARSRVYLSSPPVFSIILKGSFYIEWQCFLFKINKHYV